jgi:hypothetical protein
MCARGALYLHPSFEAGLAKTHPESLDARLSRTSGTFVRVDAAYDAGTSDCALF